MAFKITFKNAAGEVVKQHVDKALTMFAVFEHDVIQDAKEMISDGEVPDDWQDVELEHGSGTTQYAKADFEML